MKCLRSAARSSQAARIAKGEVARASEKVLTEARTAPRTAVGLILVMANLQILSFEAGGGSFHRLEA